MSIFNRALSEINRGKLGLNVGLSTGCPRLDGQIYGVQKGTYYLIGGNTGAGKSYLVNDLFLLNPYDSILADPHTSQKVKFLYFSFEMAAEKHILRAIPRYLWKHYHIETDVNYVLSRGKHSISQEIYEKVLESKSYFEKLEDSIVFIDSAQGKTKIDKVIKKHAKDNGQFYQDANGAHFYKPNDLNLTTVIILDHNGLTKKEDETSTKGVIDGLSKRLVEYRNVCGFTPVVLNQFNRDMDSIDRVKKGLIEPQLSDFKDTSGSQEDANMVLGIGDPFRYGHSKYRSFDIEILRSYFRGLHILKNRDGDSGGFIGLNFFGNVGIFKELPKSKEMTQEDYEKAISLQLNK